MLRPYSRRLLAFNDVTRSRKKSRCGIGCRTHSDADTVCGHRGCVQPRLRSPLRVIGKARISLFSTYTFPFTPSSSTPQSTMVLSALVNSECCKTLKNAYSQYFPRRAQPSPREAEVHPGTSVSNCATGRTLRWLTFALFTNIGFKKTHPLQAATVRSLLG